MELKSDNFISKHCGQTSEPWTIITNTNTLTVTFRSDDGYKDGTGFLAVWTATIEPPTYPTPTGCDSCNFPLAFGETAFDTCISVENVDTQPWCLSGPLSPPTDEGTHVLPYPKITCSDIDSSCPSLPPQTVITSPDYPQTYPNNAYEVKFINVKSTFDINLLYLFRHGHLALMRDRGSR